MQSLGLFRVRHWCHCIGRVATVVALQKRGRHCCLQQRRGHHCCGTAEAKLPLLCQCGGGVATVVSLQRRGRHCCVTAESGSPLLWHGRGWVALGPRNEPPDLRLWLGLPGRNSLYYTRRVAHIARAAVVTQQSMSGFAG